MIQIFERYLSGQAEAIESIDNFGKSFKTTAFGWQFELPDLHQFCRQSAPELAELEYQKFRQMLYHNPTNQILSSSGGRFELVEDRGHIDRNRYALIVTN
ncbi:MAG: hypothetical protein DRQ59_01230 [Gammaproteobacteria bacterium]|nr:MAG: hypothetical protein DRQ59_01230 [Gammaproteobacteria bacterium]